MKPPKDEIPEGMKWCPKCEQIHPLRAFASSLKQKDGRNSWCLECVKNSESFKLGRGRSNQKQYRNGYIPPWAKT